MKILSLDIATKTGWAFCYDDGRIESGVQDFSLKRGESPGMRFVRFRAWLNEMLELLKPDIVCYEQAHYRGGAATEVCVGLITRVHELCAPKDINYTSYHSATIKKFASGGGRCSKEEMLRLAREKWGDVKDDNEADALWILDLARSELGEG